MKLLKSKISVLLLASVMGPNALANTEVANTEVANIEVANTEVANTEVANTEVANTEVAPSLEEIIKELKAMNLKIKADLLARNISEEEIEATMKDRNAELALLEEALKSSQENA